MTVAGYEDAMRHARAVNVGRAKLSTKEIMRAAVELIERGFVTGDWSCVAEAQVLLEREGREWWAR